MIEKSLIDILWVLLSAGLVLLMQAGFLCLEAGMTRSKNSINVAIKNLADFGIAVVLFWAFGFALMFGATKGGWIGWSHFFTPVGQDRAWLATFFLFQVMFCGTAVTIISGAVAERARFAGYIIVSALVSGLIYPIFGHWAWGGNFEGASGWLAVRGFVDFAGSTVVHSVGAWAALAMALVIGARIGRFPEGGAPRNIPGSNLPVTMLGVLLLWIGWIGFNGGSTLAMNEQVPGIIANTMLAAAAGLITALFLVWSFYKYPDAAMAMNGALAGLVAITASSFAVSAMSAVIIGGIGAVFMLSVRYLLERLHIDDVVGAIPVHGGAGVWGTIAVALFGKPEILATGLTRVEQLLAQLTGIGIGFLLAFGVTYILLLIINRILPLRVTPEQEYVGLNVAEHRATTEILDLLTEMDTQAKTQDSSLRVKVEPFTEIGQIAQQYNQVMDGLEKADQELKAEQQKSEALLLNVLPGSIAERLKKGEDHIADSYDDVSVLFADVVGFTDFSTRVTPNELIDLLNQIFSAFDALSEKYSLEKIKTIGDAYMVVGGLPTPRADHAEAIAEIALDMLDYVVKLNEETNRELSIRIGINSGPVVAGVVGTKKFFYDIWGDTVNTAARMESHGLEGYIQVTAETYQRLHDKFQFRDRGIIDVKGKGDMHVYILLGRKTGPAHADLGVD